MVCVTSAQQYLNQLFSVKNRRQVSFNGLRGSRNALRRQCATILKTDTFCKESEWKSGNEPDQSTCRLNLKPMSAESGPLQPFDASLSSAATKGLTSDMKLRFQLYWKSQWTLRQIARDSGIFIYRSHSCKVCVGCSARFPSANCVETVKVPFPPESSIVQFSILQNSLNTEFFKSSKRAWCGTSWASDENPKTRLLTSS